MGFPTLPKQRYCHGSRLAMTRKRNKKDVILNEVKNLPVGTTDECRTSLEILRYTQDDCEEENKKNKQ